MRVPFGVPREERANALSSFLFSKTGPYANVLPCISLDSTFLILFQNLTLHIALGQPERYIAKNYYMKNVEDNFIWIFLLARATM